MTVASPSVPEPYNALLRRALDRSSPAVAYDKVFVAATTQNEAKMYALPAMDPNSDGQILDNANPALSELVWTFTLPPPHPLLSKLIESTPAVYQTGVFFGGDDGIVWALPTQDPNLNKVIDPDTENLWRYETWVVHGISEPTANDRVKSSPAIHDRLDVSPAQRVVFVGARRSLLALDREVGTLLWKYIIPLDSPPTNDHPVTASPAIAAGTGMVYIQHEERDLGVPYAFLYGFLEVEFNPPDGIGDLLWKRPLSNPPSLSSPAVFDGLLFIGQNPYPGIDYHVWAIKDP